MKRKTHKRSYFRLVSNILLITAFVLLNYPLVSDIIHQKISENSCNDYQKTVFEKVNYDEEIKKADEYNKTLVFKQDRFISEKTNKEYEELMSVQGNIMAYVSVEKAGIITAPVYHYTSTESLQAGAGHLAGSSLPSDKPGVHTVISGHSGMSGMKMFSKLPDMAIGDTFEIVCLNKLLRYETVDINTVLPEDTSLLGIDPNENYCSLITCTPIGLNTHRLIVTGKLKETKELTNNEVVIKIIQKPDIKNRFAKYEIVMSGFSVIILGLLIKDNFLKKKKETKNEKVIRTEDDLLTPDELRVLFRQNLKGDTDDENVKEIPFDFM